ncbi:MAG: hypothetical protein OXJ53_02340 [Gammaproteobacteria bacterium]|nr:hypothetical protein [Gammaproteobacteria bacterium]MDD9960923.1 hypothetical protein [Gammaproteobacteria bacterium]MDE0273581.1 hypothetical protein [Gammaproteobacteria bacterium]MYH15361.1 hypothetical protein [Gammaproteobacteria bacterium]MYK84423.1 hypothetical protein [Gammaproteobacteria bacterium]
MAQRLESSGLERAQAYAVIEEIGNAIEKFAVTPEVLRKELEANNKVIFQRIDRLESLVKLGMGWLFAFLVALLGGMMGLMGMLLP